jgi:DNA polymerase/3'-5' exonuclease PolX
MSQPLNRQLIRKRKVILERVLQSLAYYESNEHKKIAFLNGVAILSALTTEQLYKYLKKGNFQELPGIGKSLNAIFLDVFVTGESSRLTNTIEEVFKNSDIKARKTYSSVRVPYNVASQWVNRNLGNIVNRKNILCGSYRRKKQTIADLDLLIPEEDYDRIVNILTRKGFELETRGKYKGNFIIEMVPGNKTHLDIVTYTPETFVGNLVYLTGSREFNIRMRSAAKKLGYKLNQNGLFKGKTQIPLKKEEDLFKYLNMPFVEPIKRN